MDDILDLFSEYHFPILISSLGPQMKHAIRSICHELDSSPSFFRFDESLLLKIMRTKVKKVASHLPKSIEFEAITKNFMDNIQGKELNSEKKPNELRKIIQLARIKTAMQLINNYLPIKYANLLLQSEDFTPLSLYLQKLQTHRASTLFIQNINHFTTDFYLKKDTVPKEKNKNKRSFENDNTRIQKKMDTKQINKITSFFKIQNKN
ncbi:hypothetical protein PNEG_03344 [Pneumocystis murina B123]|uniref:Ribonuclease H2 subunit B wHTH domain-containing protein n=1 Tax=Pneumocystis murina (strain B123) TaxID=1069680 RepID=M7P2R4_PNEMU|nr:hypothetical protein PNEG_03344 [Pneumocystis murina B123]EMR08170.1 hypothetical protein PNEG_03344 [Pneumocystis murina B123]